ncbi:MAG: flavodoxin domain-containing protein [Deltaproteobacteria bacterium]|nr:flavodoxin domain-containing protein [Deltaproteobacteria bacterium]
MKKVLIIFGSTTGNTEYMAGIIGKGFIEAGFKTALINAADFDPGELQGDLSAIILGCPAYGHDTVELQDEFAVFFEELDSIDLKNRSFAVFAPGDSSYEHYCGSVDLIEEKLESLGALRLCDGLRVDGDPQNCKGEISDWADSVINGINIK